MLKISFSRIPLISPVAATISTTSKNLLRRIATRGSILSLVCLFTLFIALPSARAQFDTTWTNFSPTNSPSIRDSVGMAYDPQTKLVVQFGGEVNGFAWGQTWTWATGYYADWEFLRQDAPPARTAPMMIYDPATKNIVLFGGVNLSGFTLFSDTWLWNGTSWTQQNTAHSPSGRYLMAATYDATLQKIVLFGGTDGTVAFGDTWTYDGTDWTQESPATSPGVRYGDSMAYDANLGVSVLYGGTDGTYTGNHVSQDAKSDTWTYDGNTWTQQNPAQNPGNRLRYAMTYDGNAKKVVLFGGQDPEYKLLSDVWTYDGTNWVQGTQTNSPSARYAAAMVYDGDIGQDILFSGVAYDPNQGFNVSLNDTWTLQLAPGASAPTVTGISSSSGSPAGGGTITITGTNLTGATAVKFGSTAASNVAVMSDTQVTATIPAGTGTVDVTVTTPGGTSATSTADQYTYQAAQSITFTPASPVTYGVSPITLTATGGASGNPVTFSLVSGPGSVSGSTLTVTGPGTIVVAANQAGSGGYTAAPQVQRSITVLQPLSVTAAAITVYAGVPSTQYVSQLLSSYNALGLNGLQLESALSNAEFGFTVSVGGGSYNIPLISYGTYYGANLLNAVPAGAPTGTFTLTPYLIGPGAAKFNFSETPGSLTISNLQPLSVTAANITVHAGQTPTQYVAQLMASYNAPGLTGLQLETKLANAEFGFKVTVGGGSYNIPLISYGTYYGANLLNEVPVGAPTGTFTLTPYLIGPGAAQFSFSETPGSLTIAYP